MTERADPRPKPLPADLAAVALINASTCAAPGEMSISWLHEEVRTGRAPAPVIRKQRCTRWRLADVRDFWAKMAEQGAADVQSAADLRARATKASAAAKAKRAAPANAAAK